MRVVLPGAADAAEHLNAIFDVGLRRGDAGARRQGRRNRVLVGVGIRRGAGGIGGGPPRPLGLLGAAQHLRTKVLDGLEAADRLAELLAHLGVGDRGVQRPSGHAGGLGRPHRRRPVRPPSLRVSISSVFPPAGRIRTPPSAAPSAHGNVPVARDVSPSNWTETSEPSRATPAKRSPEASAPSSSGEKPTSERMTVASAVVATGPATSALAASETIAHRSSMLPPAPPQSSATATPNSPSSARLANTGRQASRLPCSISRTAAVPPLRAQSRTNSRAANCSSVTVATTCESSAP